MAKMDIEELFRKYNIKPCQVNLLIENFDHYRQSQPTAQTVPEISTDKCVIILSSFETEELMRALENKKHQKEMEKSKDK